MAVPPLVAMIRFREGSYARVSCQGCRAAKAARSQANLLLVPPSLFTPHTVLADAGVVLKQEKRDPTLIAGYHCDDWLRTLMIKQVDWKTLHSCTILDHDEMQLIGAARLDD